MPIFKASGKVIYFAHVPKCAGTAVERYLRQRFGGVAFLDGSFHERPADRRWTNTSPQHVTASTLASLFPADFFDASFAVVRHPVERMISEYHFLRDSVRRIPATQGFSEWLNTLPKLLETNRSAYDNHVRPMCELLPRGTAYFHLEDGLDRVIAYLDRIVGNRGGPRIIAPLMARNPAIAKAMPSAEDVELISHLYGLDFKAFGYDVPRTAARKPPLPSPAVAPLSWSRASVVQEAMWLSPYAAVEPAGHNLLRVIRFDGPCDTALISNAVSRLVERHTILRAVFQWKDGRLFWAAKPHEPILLSEEPAYFDRVTFGLEPYDVERGPLFRFRIVRTGPTSLELLCGFHHLIIDGTSWAKLVHELTRLILGEELASPGPDYREHVAWQERWLGSAEAEQSRAYWRRKLKSLPATSSVPALGKADATKHRRGGAEFTISERLSASLRDASVRHGVSPFRIVLTVFTALLARVTRREDVMVATTLTGRSGPMTKDMQGPFVNTGLLQARILEEETSFSTLLEDMDAELRDAVNHQEYPLLAALREVNAGNSARHPALTCVQMTRMPEPLTIELGPLTITDTFQFLPVNDRELSIRFQATPKAFRMDWTYATHLLDSRAVERLQGQFELLLQAALENPEMPLSKLDTITPAERTEVLRKWNDTAVAFPALAPVHRMIEAQTARTPGNVAVIDPERTWSYRDLDSAANRVAALLLRNGLKARDYVILQMHPSAAMIAAELAVMKCGAAFVPAGAEWPENRVAEISARLGQSTLILADSASPGRLSIAAEMTGKGDPGTPNIATSIDDPVYCIFTSGSTGRPKGAVNCHRGIANHLLSRNELYGSAANDAVLASAPGTVDSHVWQFFWPLICGGRVVVAPRSEMVAPTALCRLALEHSISVAYFVPSIFAEVIKHLGQHGAKEFATLRLMITGGEAMRAPDVHRLRSILPTCRVVNSYGPTETSIASLWFEVPSGQMDPVPIGRPIPNTYAVILNGTQLTPVGMVGELCLGGACMGLGYLDDPGETARSFIRNPFPELACSTLYRTGDLARMRPDGVIECLGRIDNQIKIRGQRIEPGEVEAALQRHPDIDTAVVWAEGDGADARLVAGFVAATGRDGPDAAALRSFLRRDLPIHLVPSVFRKFDEMPLLPGGKVDRKSVVAAAGRPVPAERRKDPPRGQFEERLAALWSAVLGTPDIGRSDNFLEDLGGDSLQAMRLVALIEEHFGVKAELRWVFEASELKEMSLLIQGASRSRRSNALELQRRYLATWRGWKRHADGLLFAQNRDGIRQPLFWCFQGEREMMQLARALGPDQPVVGMRSGHLMKNAVKGAVHELAEAYAEEITRCQPKGPICLGGNCQGSEVAQLVASRLTRLGRHISMLILLEATSFEPYDGQIALLFGSDSHLNPFRTGNDPLPAFQKAYRTGFRTAMVPGAHGEFFEARNVPALAAALRKLTGDAHSSADARLEMSIFAQ